MHNEYLTPHGSADPNLQKLEVGAFVKVFPTCGGKWLWTLAVVALNMVPLGTSIVSDVQCGWRLDSKYSSWAVRIHNVYAQNRLCAEF